MAFLTGWSYRKEVTISRASGAVTNYQMKILVGESSGAVGEDVDCGALCKTDFSDLRFTNNDGTTLLDYWIESVSGTTPNQLATVWVEFDSIGTGATTFYMYYGNAGASSASSGANTFIIFDDFERGNHGDAVGGGWSVGANAPKISTALSFGGTRCCWFDTTTTAAIMYRTITASADIAIQFRAYKGDLSSFDFVFGDAGSTAYPKWENDEKIWAYNGSSWVDSGLTPSYGAWHKIEMRDFDWTANTNKFVVDDVSSAAMANHTVTTYANKLQFDDRIQAVDRDFWIDNFIVRNWRTTEPAFGSWGDQETSGSWVDNFDDGSLDTSKFGTSVAGGGAVAESGGTLNITMAATANDAAIVYIKDAIGSNADYVYRVRQKIDGSVSGGIMLFGVVNNATPAVTDNTTWNATRRIGVFYSGTELYINYVDTGGTFQYWTGSTWTSISTPAYSATSISYWHEIVFQVRNGSWRISIYAKGETKALAESPYITFAALQSYTTLKAFWGESYNNFYYVTSMKSDYVKYENETAVYAFYNGKTNAGDYRIGRAISFDGGYRYNRDPVTAVIVALAGESDVKDVFVMSLSGTYHMVYAALMSSGIYSGKWRIRYATSSDLVSWSDQGYITTPGGGGDWDENGHITPILTNDLAGTFRLYVCGKSAAGGFTIGYYYGASLGSLSEGANPIINAGVASSWNDGGVQPLSIYESGNTIYMHIAGLNLSSAKWQGGLYTSTDWSTWIADVGNPVVARTAAAATTGSNCTAGAITLTVSDSTVFEVDDPIIIGDGSDREVNRIASKSDGTHITLYFPIVNSYTAPTIAGYNSGSVAIEGLNKSIFLSSALGTAWQASAVLLETTSWWDYDAGWTYSPSKTPPLPVGAGWDNVSAENIKWIHDPQELTRLQFNQSFFIM